MPGPEQGGKTMAKTIDITDKLSFNTNPKLVIKGESFEVNAEAKTMLEIMGLFSNKNESEATIEAYGKIFSEKDRKKFDKMHLSFEDFQTIMSEAMDLIRGNVDDEGEA
mgnify:CR=1 FL=1